MNCTIKYSLSPKPRINPVVVTQMDGYATDI